MEFVSRSYVPIEKSLKICLERGAVEASAILSKRGSEYFRAIELYTQVLVQEGAIVVNTLFDEHF